MSAPYQPHSATSIAAAKKVEKHINEQHTELLTHFELVAAEGTTDNEQQRALGIKPSTQCPRRLELQRYFDLVFDSGRKRKTDSGNDGIVWVLRQYCPAQLIPPQLAANVQYREREANKREVREAAKAQLRAEKAAIKAKATGDPGSAGPRKKRNGVAPAAPVVADDPFNINAPPAANSVSSPSATTAAKAPAPAKPADPFDPRCW